MRKLSPASFLVIVLLITPIPILSVGAEFPSLAPTFTLTDIDGQSFSLSDLRGKPVALTFIASRSVVCKLQVMILVNISRIIGDNATFIVIGVSNDMIRIGGDTDAQLRDFRNETGFEGKVAKDTGNVSRDYGVTFIPMTFLIDTLGNIWYRHVGVMDASENIIVNELMFIPEYPTTAIILVLMVLGTLIVAGNARHNFQRNSSHKEGN
jgi:peroxiredoxin